MAESSGGNDSGDDLDEAIRRRRKEGEGSETDREFQKTLNAIRSGNFGNEGTNNNKRGNNESQQPRYSDKYESEIPFDSAPDGITPSAKEVQEREGNNNQITIMTSLFVFEDDRGGNAASIRDAYVMFSDPDKEGRSKMEGFLTEKVKHSKACVEVSKDLVEEKAGSSISKEYYMSEVVYVH